MKKLQSSIYIIAVPKGAGETKIFERIMAIKIIKPQI